MHQQLNWNNILYFRIRNLSAYKIDQTKKFNRVFFAAFAIRCWTCNSQTATESFCDDPFDSSIVYRQNRVWSYTDCILPPVSAYNPGYGGGSAAYGGNGAYNSYTSYNGPNRLRPVCQKSKDRSKFARLFLYFIFKFVEFCIDFNLFYFCSWWSGICTSKMCMGEWALSIQLKTKINDNLNASVHLTAIFTKLALIFWISLFSFFFLSFLPFR